MPANETLASLAAKTDRLPSDRNVATDYNEVELIRKMITNIVSRKIGVAVPRWSAVADAFALGSTYSYQLCLIFGFDPEEDVRAPTCSACEYSEDGEDEDDLDEEVVELAEELVAAGERDDRLVELMQLRTTGQTTEHIERAIKLAMSEVKQ